MNINYQNSWLTQQTVGENLMFFQDNTRSKFTTSKT